MTTSSDPAFDRRWRAFSLVFFAVGALLLAAAVNSRSLGYALLAAGVALFGFINYRWLPVRNFRARRPLDPAALALARVASVLFVVGMLVSQLIN
jgi:hypothetical protein